MASEYSFLPILVSFFIPGLGQLCNLHLFSAVLRFIAAIVAIEQVGIFRGQSRLDSRFDHLYFKRTERHKIKRVKQGSIESAKKITRTKKGLFQDLSNSR